VYKPSSKKRGYSKGHFRRIPPPQEGHFFASPRPTTFGADGVTPPSPPMPACLRTLPCLALRYLVFLSLFCESLQTRRLNRFARNMAQMVKLLAGSFAITWNQILGLTLKFLELECRNYNCCSFFEWWLDLLSSRREIGMLCKNREY
jgi:hypothetical protein